MARRGCALAVLVLVGSLLCCTPAEGSPPGLLRPQTTAHALEGTAGWVSVDFGDAQIAVPSDWWLIYNKANCPVGAPIGEVVVNAHTTNCPAEHGGPGSYVSLQPAIPIEEAHVPMQIINRIAVYRLPGTNRFDVPALKVMIVVEGPLLQRILGTLTWSPRRSVLAQGPAPKTPASWRRITFAGISAAVPSNWPVTRTETYGYACGLVPVDAGPVTVYLDTDTELVADRCGPILGYVFPKPPSDGLSINRIATKYYPGTSGYGKCFRVNRLTACPATRYPYSILVLRIEVPGRQNPVVVSLGLAGTGVVARTILYSMRLTA